MKLYLLKQIETRGYDTFDSCVVAAASREDAAKLHPRENTPKPEWHWTWASSPANVEVMYLGEAAFGTAPGVILASFNAG